MQNPAPRIALIHATALAVEPIAQAFERNWPQARRMNLLDENIDEEQRALLQKWRIPFHHIGYDDARKGIQDDEIA